MFRKKKEDKNQKYEYCIENVTNEKTFKVQCNTLEDNLIDLIKEDLILGDDKSPMQFYMYRDEELTVLYDIELEEVYVSSPIEVLEYIIKSLG